jgi:hypothetical protein
MSVLFSIETLSLLLPTLFAFRLLPTSSWYIDAVKLAGVLGIGALVSATKWYVTNAGSLSLFSVMFPVGIILFILRFVISYGFLASFHKISADPLCLLAQVMLGLTLAIAAAMYRYDSVLTSLLITGDSNAVFFLIISFLLFFRPMFAYHELVDAKLFHPPTNEEVVKSCFQGSPSTSVGWLESAGRLVVAGLSPLFLLIVAGLVTGIPPFAVGIVVGITGILMGPSLAHLWLMIDSIRRNSSPEQRDVPISFSILISPYLALLLASIVNGTCIAYESYATSSGMSSGISKFLFEKSLVREYSEYISSGWLFVLSIQTITTIAYKRFIAEPLSSSKKRS